MPIIKEAEKVNAKVAQLKHLLDKDMIKKNCNAQWIFDRISNVNDAIVNTNYLHLHNKEWIGGTILHFAVMKKDADAFEVLLNFGADFTKKDCRDSTALHEIIQQDGTSILQEFTLNHTFVNLVLSAHLKNNNFESPSNKDGLSHFHIACAANNVKAVKGFMSRGVINDHAVSTDCSLFPGFTPLHFAARFCAFEVLKVLLSKGADIHVKDAKGLTPLHLALEQKLKIMSESYANEALVGKNEKIVELLLRKMTESNIDLMFIDDLELSQFHVACTLKDSKVAESLLKKVVNIDHTIKIDSSLWSGSTALHFAAHCNIDTVKLLMKNGADISIKDTKGVTPFDICLKRYKAEDIYAVVSLNPIWKNIVLSDGKTRLTDLLFAMRSSNQFSVFLKKLSKNFIIYNSPLWSGCSPMHLAVIFYSKASENSKQVDEDVNLQILRYLLGQCPDMLQTRDEENRTPLHLAFRLHKKPMLDLIFHYLERYPNSTNYVDKAGLSYLHVAAAENKVKVLRKLATTENINAVYKGNSLLLPTIHPGSTPLHFAVANGSTEAVDALLNLDADVYAKDVNDMTPIHLVLSTDRKKLADMLLKSRNLKDCVASGTGLSHLHIACHRNKSRVVKRLLKVGADVNGIVTYRNDGPNQMPFLEKYAGYSPLLFAYEEEVEQLLLDRGADMFIKNAKGTARLYEVFEEMDAERVEMYVRVLRKNEALQTRLEADIGMTRLHLACAGLDIDGIKRLIKEKVDVNAQIHSNAPIFQGYTALHIIMHVSDVNNEDFDDAIDLLVEAGADVTLMSKKSGTVVHMAYGQFADEDELQYIRLNELLKAQRDYSVNPVKDDGLSHFHIASNLCNTSIVQKFLDQGVVDVNGYIDYFSESEPGYSALHLVAGSKSFLCEGWKQLHTIDLLLKNGADVHAEDRYVDTSLHESARLKSLVLFDRLVRGGADVNARNSYGDTPLGCFLESDTVSAEKIRALLKHGCRINTFNPVNDKGYLGVVAIILLYTDLQELLAAIIINFEQETEIDNFGRTIIHNLVSADSSKMSAYEYAELIEKLSRVGFDVDTQDNLGRTALHLTVKFYNAKATAGLLMAGADVNITDIYGKTALACYSDLCPNCNPTDESIDGDADEECIHEILAIHVKKLQLCGLDVIGQNEDITVKVFQKLENKIALSKEFFKELEDIKNTKIEPHALTLHEFLSETGVVVDYPMMSMFKRAAINEFFAPNELESFRMKFPETEGILELQFRKARARPNLVELAKNTLTILVGFRLPEICSHFILILLKNSELKSLIASTVQ